jgi:hypothetical protein
MGQRGYPAKIAVRGRRNEPSVNGDFYQGDGAVCDFHPIFEFVDSDCPLEPSLEPLSPCLWNEVARKGG